MKSCECLNSPFMKVKILFYIHLICALGLLLSAGSSGIAKTSLLSNGFLLVSLIWVAESVDKLKSISHAHILNVIGLGFDIGFLIVRTNVSRRMTGMDGGWTLAFIIMIMCLRPFHSAVLYKESKNFVVSTPIVVAPTVNIIGNHGNFQNNLKDFHTDVHIGDSRPKTEVPVVHGQY